MITRRVVWMGALGLALSACSGLEQPAHEEAAPGIEQLDDLDEPHARAIVSEGIWRIEDRVFVPEVPVQHIGLMIDAREASGLSVRSLGLDGTWSSWAPIEITWSEGEMHVGRLALIAPATHVEFRAPHPIDHLVVEGSTEVPTYPERLTRELARQAPSLELSADGLRTRRQALAPPELVTSRADWGARDPDKICGSVIEPYRMSIHHTASPSTDGDDPAGRLRQMQAFHIDTRGWCDIGYHFIVAQSGQIFQGRSDERRPGAHVGNQNAGNIGFSLIGNYEESEPPQVQLDALVSIMAWTKETYQIPWNRDAVRGHREWPGASTACPGQNVLSKIDMLMEQAAGPVDPPSFPITLAAVGSAADGRLEFRLTNGADRAIRGVLLGLSLDPDIQATSYAIETDAPAKDQTTWMLNDADMAPENPAKDALGQAAVLTMYAFGAGETKRVVIEVEPVAAAVSARAWVVNIDDVYTQDGFGQEPSLDLVDQEEPLEAAFSFAPPMDDPMDPMNDDPMDEPDPGMNLEPGEDDPTVTRRIEVNGGCGSTVAPSTRPADGSWWFVALGLGLAAAVRRRRSSRC